MGQHDRLLTLIQELYAAPGSAHRWQTFLDGLCDAMNGSAAHFISHNLQSQRAGVALIARTDPAAVKTYVDYWGSRDPWAYSPRMREIGSAAVLLGDDLITHSHLRRTAFYTDFGRPNDIVRCIAGMIETGPRVISVVSVNGSERRGPFGSQESALLNALMPHIHRALQLHRRLTTAEAASDTFASVIDRAAHGVLLIDRTARVTYMSRVAEQLIEMRDGLLVENQELRAARGADTTRLRRLLADAAATSGGRGLGAGGALALGRPSGRRPLMALVSPLPHRCSFLADVEPPVAIVIVTDPERTEIADEDTLRALLGLTHAEATLARLLAQGLTLDDAAVTLGLRTATLRTRLKGIFEKTNTHRQTDLMRLILLLPHSCTIAPRFFTSSR